MDITICFTDFSLFECYFEIRLLKKAKYQCQLPIARQEEKKTILYFSHCAVIERTKLAEET